MAAGQKEGHSFCGCCCDMRRAVVIANILTILFNVCFIIIVGVAYKAARDGVLDEDVSLETANRALAGSLSVGFLTFLFSGLAIYGARIFNPVLVGLNAVFMFITWITVTIVNVQASRTTDYDYNWFNVVFSLFLYGIFIYPHVVFVREVRANIMTEQFYYKEEQSCCCV